MTVDDLINELVKLQAKGEGKTEVVIETMGDMYEQLETVGDLDTYHDDKQVAHYIGLYWTLNDESEEACLTVDPSSGDECLRAKGHAGPHEGLKLNWVTS